MTHPYLLQVYSQPLKVSPEIWTQWYLEEHIRDMVYFGVVKTAAFYQASSPVYKHLDLPEEKNDERSFLAMFQTDRKKALSYPEFREKVRQTTPLWGGQRGREVGELADTESELYPEVYTSKHSESAAEHIIQVKVYYGNEESLPSWQYVKTFTMSEGHRRTLMYHPQEQKPDTPLVVTLIHEFESLHEKQLRLLKEQLAHMEQVEQLPFQLRSYQLLGSEGFGGVCRTPARL